MLDRTTRWLVAAAIGFAMTAVGCSQSKPPNPAPRERAILVHDQSVVHAFDTHIEDRLLDRLQLDNFLRDRDIRVNVIDGLVTITGEVFSPLERERASQLIRSVPGVIDVQNELTVRPPE
jgi:hypothetical protein